MRLTTEEEKDRLKRQLKRAQDRNKRLNDILEEKNKSNDIYIAKKTDEIDMKLADFINK